MGMGLGMVRVVVMKRAALRGLVLGLSRRCRGRGVAVVFGDWVSAEALSSERRIRGSVEEMRGGTWAVVELLAPSLPPFTLSFFRQAQKKKEKKKHRRMLCSNTRKIDAHFPLHKGTHTHIPRTSRRPCDKPSIQPASNPASRTLTFLYRFNTSPSHPRLSLPQACAANSTYSSACHTISVVFVVHTGMRCEVRGITGTAHIHSCTHTYIQASKQASKQALRACGCCDGAIGGRS
ncbi:hypothetical protein IWZ03DRAFT_202815 [Phyllosticta citriasiana]|uniref:Uncharacterized protein n=1 Tax=Phyllosticta citriasiana TaxID=595635 RepID=A0ABR1KI80_9PEZI